MTVQIVPTFALPAWTQVTTLEGATFQLAFALNARENRVYLSIADHAGIDIYNGMPLVCLVPLLRACKDLRRPAGDLFVLDSTGLNTPPAVADLGPGGRCALLYASSDVLAQLGAGAVPASLATATTTVTTYGVL